MQVTELYAWYWMDSRLILVPFFSQQPKNVDIICIGLERVFSHQKQNNKTQRNKKQYSHPKELRSHIYY